MLNQLKVSLEAPPPPKLKKSFLGNFPYSPTMERIEEENEGDKANKENNEEESVAILEDEDESDDDIGSDDPEINEPDTAEEEDEVDSANNEVVFPSFSNRIYRHDQQQWKQRVRPIWPTNNLARALRVLLNGWGLARTMDVGVEAAGGAGAY
ncbi:hypothetical protein VP01_1974g1 [Puccinia sorghi]|uniref:Uncharacterized protein n=1 Tax=Puccinia sorghi TaxID=27349 RepID=A0A0L6VBP5_9BASI|nr:hypothetical protein VP01_1974g1 [Puccinia sorghi]